MAAPVGPGLDMSFTTNLQTILFKNTEAVTPTDNVQFPPSYIRCGGAGTLAYINQSGEVIPYGSVIAGERIVSAVFGVMATGTSATNITRHW